VTLALWGVLLFSAASATAGYQPPHSHSCGKVKKSVTYKVYAANISCGKGRRVFKQALRKHKIPKKWSCELRQFPGGSPGIVCRAGGKRIYGISK
jgi:hypothetical protein